MAFAHRRNHRQTAFVAATRNLMESTTERRPYLISSVRQIPLAGRLLNL